MRDGHAVLCDQAGGPLAHLMGSGDHALQMGGRTILLGLHTRAEWQRQRDIRRELRVVQRGDGVPQVRLDPVAEGVALVVGDGRQVANGGGIERGVRGEQLAYEDLVGAGGANEGERVAHAPVGIPRRRSLGKRRGDALVHLLPDVLDLAGGAQVAADVGVAYLVAHVHRVEVAHRLTNFSQKAFRGHTVRLLYRAIMPDMAWNAGISAISCIRVRATQAPVARSNTRRSTRDEYCRRRLQNCHVIGRPSQLLDTACVGNTSGSAAGAYSASIAGVRALARAMAL